MKTFYVQIFIGHRAVSWPFGRLDIADRSITARAWPSWYMKVRSAPREDIRTVAIKHYRTGNVLTIDDAGAVFARLYIYYTLGIGRHDKLRAELERCGYVVVDQQYVGLLSRIRRKHG